MSGKPMIVISPNGIEYATLKQLNMNTDDLMEMIRQNGYYSFDQVLYAIIETNGKMSVIPTSENAPATAQDIKVNNPPAQIPYIVVSDGKIIKASLSSLKIDENDLTKILEFLKIKSIKDLLMLSIDKKGKIYYQVKNKKYQTYENIFKEVK